MPYDIILFAVEIMADCLESRDEAVVLSACGSVAGKAAGDSDLHL